MSHRIQIPFVVDTLEENPEGSGKFASRPVVGASVVIENRAKAEAVVVYAVENPEESSTVTPTTDVNGRINGWLKEGSYLIKVTGGKPFIAPTTMAFDALSGRGVEYTNVEAITVAELLLSVQHALVPAGAMFDYGGTAAPAGFLLQDGKGYANTEWPDLFAAIGYNFGKPSAGHFNVPDSRGRVKVGTGSGPGLTVRTIGQQAGVEEVKLTTAQVEGHTHSQTPVGGSANVSGNINANSGNYLSGRANNHTHSPPQGLGGRNYLNHAQGGDENAAPRYLSKDSSGETQVLWGNGGWGNSTGGVDGGSVACRVDEGYLSGSMSGSISTNSGTTGSTGGGTSHTNVQPILCATGIIKT
jgi:microcystin-dependent protein